MMNFVIAGLKLGIAAGCIAFGAGLGVGTIESLVGAKKGAHANDTVKQIEETVVPDTESAVEPDNEPAE